MIFHDPLFLGDYMNKTALRKYQEYLPQARTQWTDSSADTSVLGLDRVTLLSLIGSSRDSVTRIADVYKAWARARLEVTLNDSELTVRIDSRDEFEAWHAELVESLQRYWSKRQAEDAVPTEQGADTGAPEVDLISCYRLVDLFIRYLRVHADSHPDLAEMCLHFGHATLDQKSLAYVSVVYSSLLFGTKLRLEQVATKDGYENFQRLAMAITKHGGYPVLLGLFTSNSPYVASLAEEVLV